jgi:cysteine desulfurase / selenocysteine lyase
VPGHKCLFGPTGTGFLYVGPRVQPKPWREGGTGGDSLTPTQPRDYPYFLEGGTPNVHGIVGLTEGLNFVEERTPEAIREHDVKLCDLLRERLADVPGVEFFGHTDAAKRVGTISFRAEVLPAPELGGLLDQQFGIAVRPGLHCSPYIHQTLGTSPDGLIRVSPGPFSTSEEILQMVEAMKEIVSV